MCLLFFAFGFTLQAQKVITLTIDGAIYLGCAQATMSKLVNTFRPLSAVTLFRIVRQFKPDLGIVWYNLGALDWEVNQRAEAVDSFQQAIKLDPSIAEAYLPLGNAAIEQDRFTEAIGYFEQALQLKPGWPEAQINLGQALALAGRVAEAEAIFRQVAATAPRDSPAVGEAHLVLGSLYQRRGALDSAAQAYRAAEDWLASPQSSDWSFMSSALNLLQAKYAIDAGHWLTATELLSVEYPSTMQAYVLHLLNQMQPELAVTTPALTEVLSSTLNVDPPLTLWIGTHATDWLVMADVLSRCQATSLRQLDTLTCLPVAPAQRLDAVYGRLWLREIEPETSYVDLIAVRLITAGGREIVLKSASPSLNADDGHYLILQQGDEHMLSFDVPPGALPARAAWVVAVGYYVPHLLDESR